MVGYIVMNCHGCKWLDRYKKDGNGYCCMVEMSIQGKALREWLQEHREDYSLGRKEKPSIKVRTPDMERCELYKPGDWKTRWETERRAGAANPPQKG